MSSHMEDIIDGLKENVRNILTERTRYKPGSPSRSDAHDDIRAHVAAIRILERAQFEAESEAKE